MIKSIAALLALASMVTVQVDCEAPYPASGWKPAGQRLELPQRHQQQSFAGNNNHQQQFGSSDNEQQFASPEPRQRQPFNPQQNRNDRRASNDDNRQQVYRPPGAYVPAQKYGPPTTTEADPFTTTDSPITTTESFGRLAEERERESASNGAEAGETVEAKAEIDRGVYYVYQPSGLLQRISYRTENDAGNMAFMAQLRYENVDPIKEPIYYYNPDTLTLQRIQL